MGFKTISLVVKASLDMLHRVGIDCFLWYGHLLVGVAGSSPVSRSGLVTSQKENNDGSNGKTRPREENNRSQSRETGDHSEVRDQWDWSSEFEATSVMYMRGK